MSSMPKHLLSEQVIAYLAGKETAETEKEDENARHREEREKKKEKCEEEKKKQQEREKSLASVEITDIPDAGWVDCTNCPSNS